MKFLLLLLILFITLAHSCVPPFNDFRYIDNEALLHDAIAEYTSNPEGGWLNAMHTGSPIKPWPKDSAGISFIKFCYANEQARNRLSLILKVAWSKWYNKLGNAGQGKGHRMGGFQETQENGASLFCFTDSSKQTWNSKVPADTMRLDTNDGTTESFASMGYRPAEWDNNNGRHRLQIGWIGDKEVDRAWAAYDMAHEMGHIFGFRHEHQRQDRKSPSLRLAHSTFIQIHTSEHYLHFACENLKGYAQVVTELPKCPSLTLEILCTSPLHARAEPWRSFGFGATEFSTIFEWDPYHKGPDGQPDGDKHPYNEIQSQEYDRTSIMQYSSFAYQRPEINDQTVTVNNVPLIMWKAGAPDYVPPMPPTSEWAFVMKVSYQSGPSAGDVEGVRFAYPWEG